MPRIWPRSSRDRTRDPLLARSGSPRKRDAYKAATAGITGITAFGALTVTGAVAGMAANQQAQQEPGSVSPPASPAAQAVTKLRPHRTVVRTRVVHVVSSSGVSRPASGGTVRVPSRPSSASHSSGGSSGSPTASHPAPAPAPAPSSGS